MYKSLRGLNFSQMFAVFLILFSLILIATAVSAWTQPPANPPDSNVAAPINVGTENQIKNGGIGVNALAVFGNAVLSGTNRYLNFGDGALESGYGIRDHNGVIECKNKNGSWGTCGGGIGDGGGNASFLICSNSSTDPHCIAAQTNFGVGDAHNRAISCRHQNPQTPGNVGLQLTYKSGIWYYYTVDSNLQPCVDNTLLVATWGGSVGESVVYTSKYGSGRRCENDAWIASCMYTPGSGWNQNFCVSRGHTTYYAWKAVWFEEDGGYKLVYDPGSAEGAFYGYKKFPIDLVCDI